MDEVSDNLQRYQCSLPMLEMYSSMELILENSTLNLNGLIDFSNDCFPQQLELPIYFTGDTLSGFSVTESSNSGVQAQFMASGGDVFQERTRKRKVMGLCSSTAVSEIGIKEVENVNIKNVNYGGVGKKRTGRCHGKQVEKPKDVIHVRARRGQATDSHSIAERARREKINEKLKSLQDIVPGCYKAMGMAAMLDEIIRYVQSLQNQIEFLSMKLSVADSFYNFCVEMESADTQQATQAMKLKEGDVGDKRLTTGMGLLKQS